MHAQPQPVGIVTAKNPAVGGLLNGVWPGVGNIYAGQTVIGLLLMFIATPVLRFWFINGMIFFFASVDGDHGWLTVLVSLITATTPMLLWVGGIVWGVFAVRSFNVRNGITVR